MRKSKILIVEDERVIADDLQLSLTEMGYDVTGIATSEATFHTCVREALPDLVLMDIYLKGQTDGIALAGEAGKQYGLPVIFLTAYADEQILERAKKAGPFGYIVKPFNSRELHAVVEMALNKNQSGKQIEHLNSVLKALIGVKKLIARAENETDLIQTACEILRSTRGYSSAWIVLVNDDKEFQEFVSSGLTPSSAAFSEMLKNGYQPDCITCQCGGETFQIRHSGENCKDCLLRDAYPENDVLTAKIQYQDKLLGYLAVSAPSFLLRSPEEIELATQIADDLALGISNLERQKNKVQTEMALRESEKRLRNLFDLIPDGIGVHTDGRLTFANPAAARMFGITEPENLFGKSVLEFVHPDFRKNVMERISAVLQENTIAPLFNEVFLRLDGTVMNVEVTAIPFDDRDKRSVLVVFKDITERKKANDELIRAKEEWEKTFDAIPDLIAIIDTDHRIVKANLAMVRSLGGSLEKTLGCHCFEAVHGMKDIPEFCPHAKSMISGQEERSEVDEQLLGGTFDVTTTPLFDEHGKMTGSVHVARDISLVKEREQLMIENVALGEFALTHSMDDLLSLVIDKAENLTGSTIGFLHFVDVEKQSISLQTWSTNTLKSFCSAKPDEVHYPFDMAGVWTDCIRAKQPVILNDYAGHPNKKGMPEGHAPLIRQLTIPILRNDNVVAVLGVGNKLQDYDKKDVDMLSEFTNLAYEYIVSKRFEEALRKSERYARALLDAIPDIIFRIDRDGTYIDYKARKEELYSKTYAIIGKNNRDLLPMDVAVKIEEAIRLTLEKQEMVLLEYQLPMEGHDLLDFEARVVPNGTEEVIAFVRDITERKKTEEVLKKKVAELEWFNQMMVDRELKMIELKKEINILANRLGETDKYVVHYKQEIK